LTKEACRLRGHFVVDARAKTAAQAKIRQIIHASSRWIERIFGWVGQQSDRVDMVFQISHRMNFKKLFDEVGDGQREATVEHVCKVPFKNIG